MVKVLDYLREQAPPRLAIKLARYKLAMSRQGVAHEHASAQIDV